MTEDSGFEMAYGVELDPEFPPTGEWACPVYALDQEGHLVEDFTSRWGTPRVVRVQPACGSEWVGMFPASGLGGTDGVLATPSPAHMCVLVNGTAYVLDINAPEAGALVTHDAVWQVKAVSSPPLLLLVTSIDMLALGPLGIAWRSVRLVLDGLQVLGACEHGIHCSGYSTQGEVPPFVVDPATGEAKG